MIRFNPQYHQEQAENKTGNLSSLVTKSPQKHPLLLTQSRHLALITPSSEVHNLKGSHPEQNDGSPPRRTWPDSSVGRAGD